MLLYKLVLKAEYFASGLHDEGRTALIVFIFCFEISIFVIEKCNFEVLDKLIKGGCLDPMLFETDEILG